MSSAASHLSGAVETPVVMSREPYVSGAYALEEKPRLWSKVWQVACREEEIPKVGNFYTYEIQDQSIIVVRTGEDEISAYYNACRHRGRRLTEGCGRVRHFQCPYHGWRWNLQGENTRVLDRDNWNGALKDDMIRLRPVQSGRWGGFVFVNLDPDCGSLEDFLEEVPYWIGPFELEGMRYKWRQWLRLPCNWKVVLEAFIEGYHAEATHPQLMQFGGGRTGSSAEGLHGRLFTASRAVGGAETGVGGTEKLDTREIPYLGLKQARETIWSMTTDTLVDAAKRVPELLPEGASGLEVGLKLMETARQMDAERGVEWPSVPLEHMALVGINWHVFPNTVLLPATTWCLGFRMRPDGFEPHSSILEVFALERYPEGEAPRTSWEHKPDTTGEDWPLLLKQDFGNLAEVQLGMRANPLEGLLPNPAQEACVINFQRNLAAFMGGDPPEPLGSMQEPERTG